MTGARTSLTMNTNDFVRKATHSWRRGRFRIAATCVAAERPRNTTTSRALSAHRTKARWPRGPTPSENRAEENLVRLLLLAAIKEGTVALVSPHSGW